MPAILVKDFTWRQTPEEIIIFVSLTGKPKKVDIFAIENYLKVSYPPFILELFLHDEILEDKSSCTLSEELAILTLKKLQEGREWPTLTLENLTKDDKKVFRIQALEKARLSAEKRAEKRSETRQLLQRKAVREQIELDTRVHNHIQELRDNHRREAMTQFDDWRQKAEVPICGGATGVLQENRKQYKTPVKWFKDSPDPEPSSKSPPVDALNNKQLSHKKQLGLPRANTREILENNNEEDMIRGKKIINDILNGKYREHNEIFDDTPRPRKCATINVNFSERIFPTPARESSQLQEQEWLVKQAEARRKCGFATEDLSQEEQDPQWLKDKGDEFLNVGNYLGAISAYTHGVKLSPNMSSLYANRAAAQYALGNYNRCAEDSSKALELMVPKCEGNRDSRARCHARLGAALCKLSAPQHGIPEFEEALKLAPENDTIRRDLEEAKHYFHLHNSNQ
ncbi:dyslexia susceptibility 1 candidate gene 1 protein homolog isoform X2 [Fopius arisanus]|uniref:Dyslexia susceptibility 1 candidate gene 1 protein homolog isoform X2 n=1 Tax=Fopius arisanus TaxID=64838 RepID=A0A9R1T1X7_9HYME|nr:PREDICTED: dyslexia susceptibility 1 candidate gene 1 protein homolog isoform X2 [Fopius arisanus]